MLAFGGAEDVDSATFVVVSPDLKLTYLEVIKLGFV